MFANGSSVWLGEWFRPSTKSDDQNPVEGWNGTGACVDEAQVFPDSTVVKRLRGRCRVPLTEGVRRQRPFIATFGLPVAEAWWEQHASESGGVCLYPKSADNLANLDPDWLDDAKRELDPDEFDALVLNRPMPPKGQVYYSWRAEEWPDGNLVSGWAPSAEAETVVTMDFGRTPAALFIQRGFLRYPDGRREEVDIIFDEVAPTDADIEVFVGSMLKVAWPRRFDKAAPRGVSLRLGSAYGDPAGRARDTHGLDDISWMLNAPPQGIGLHVHTTTDQVRRSISAGVRRVSRRIYDGRTGARRLVCTRELWDRGVAAPQKVRTFARALLRYRYADNGLRDPIKDGYADHHCDALRYWAIQEHWYESPLDGRMGASVRGLLDDAPKPRWSL